jgi:hypothetical protein
MLALVLAFAFCQEEFQGSPPNHRFHLYAELGCWWPAVRGRFNVDEVHSDGWFGTDRVSGTNLDLDQNLGLRGDRALPTFQIGFELGDRNRPNLHFSGVKSEFWFRTWSGSSVLNSEETVEGTVFPAGSAVQSELEATYVGVDAVFHAKPNEILFLTLTTGMRFLFTHLEMESASVRESVSDAAILYLGAGLKAEWEPVPRFLVGGSLGFHFGLLPPGMIWEGSAFLGARAGPFRLEGGYQFFWLGSVSGAGATSLFMGGPFVGLEMRF